MLNKNKKIIAKLKTAELLGRGGANFPTHLKWQMVLSAPAKKKYIVANGSEGEPNTSKDGFILANYPAKLIAGIKIALDTFENSEAYIYLRKDYYKKYKLKLEKLIGRLPITVFKEAGGYLSGEETTLCQEIEGQIHRPRIKPPFPSQAGIFGLPTLINNIETFYCIAQIDRNQYKKTRFYTISGQAKHPGVFELPLGLTIKQVLEKTNNWPSFNFFLQVGGGASGEIFLPSELDKPVEGSGSIVIYNKDKTDPWVLMRQWIDFFMDQNCDKCTPCREGTYRLLQMIKDRQFDEKALDDLLFVLEHTSFCALGKMVVMPFRSAVDKLLK